MAPTTNQRRARRLLRLAQWFALMAIVVLVGMRASHLRGVLAGEQTWTGRPVFAEPYPIRAEALADVDLDLVHRKLLPGWQSRLARAGPDAIETQRAHEALRVAVAPDPNLSLLLREMSDLAAEPRKDPERLLYLTWAWSDYLDRAGQPWLVQGSVRINEDGLGLFYSKNYAVVSDLALAVGKNPVRVRLVERVDSTNVVERYLGLASSASEGALVVVDRVRDVALDVVWPMLGREGTLADMVRAEAARTLSVDTYDNLLEVAAERAALMDAVHGIRARESCGSRFVIPQVPWDGFTPESRARFFGYAEASTGSRCPTVTHAEAVAMERASVALDDKAPLREAVGELVAWVSRSVVVHEARHIADVASGRVVDGNYLCDACEDGLSAWARAEASAYLSSLSEPGDSIALAEMCAMSVAPGRLPEHYRDAVDAVLQELVPGGCEQIPPDLRKKARALEVRWFGRYDRVVVENLPASLGAQSRSLMGPNRF